MSIFALHFRNHVMPRLRTETHRQAVLIVAGSTSYGDAHATIMDAARRYGATYLPARIRIGGKTVRPLAELEDWINKSLLAAVLEVEEGAATIERRATTDPIAHYSELTAASRDPDRMRWVFAAISPEYRAHLLAVSRERA